MDTNKQPLPKPTFAPDGVVHVPAFELPPSGLISPEAVALLKARGSRPQHDFSPAASIEEMRAAAELAVAPMVEAAKRRYPVDIVEQSFAGVKTRVITSVTGEADHSRVLINLHGGGFMMCAEGCALVELIPIAAVGRFKVITVDYRQGPEHAFPAASQDVTSVYQELLENYRPENIGIFGCSAGGALTAQVAAWLHDKKLPAPAAIGIFGAGGTRFGAGDSAHVAAYIDGSFPAPRGDGELLPSGYFRTVKMDDPLVSPALHLDVVAHFPPTLVITGTRAMDMSPAIYTHSQLLKAGADSHLVVGEAMGHCYLYNPDLPESRDAYDVIVKFFNSHLGKRR